MRGLLLALLERLQLADELDAKVVEPLVVLLVLLAHDRVAEGLGVPGVGVLDPEAIPLEVGQLGGLPVRVDPVEFNDEDPTPGGLAPADFLVERRQLADGTTPTPDSRATAPAGARRRRGAGR